MSDDIYYPGMWVRVPSIHVNWLIKLPSGFGSRGWFEMHGYITSTGQTWDDGELTQQTIKVRDWFNGDEFSINPSISLVEPFDQQPEPKRVTSQ